MYLHIPTHRCTHIHTHTYSKPARIHPCTFTHIPTHIPTHTPAPIHTLMYLHTYTHTYTHIHTYLHTHLQTHLGVRPADTQVGAAPRPVLCSRSVNTRRAAQCCQAARPTVTSLSRPGPPGLLAYLVSTPVGVNLDRRRGVRAQLGAHINAHTYINTHMHINTPT